MGQGDLRDVSDAKEAVLQQWDARLTTIFDAYQSHPRRLRLLRTAMEERLLRAFAGLINQLRQQDLGIERYIWRSRDDAQVSDSHAEHDDQVFNWDELPAGGQPGRFSIQSQRRHRQRAKDIHHLARNSHPLARPRHGCRQGRYVLSDRSCTVAGADRLVARFYPRPDAQIR